MCFLMPSYFEVQGIRDTFQFYITLNSETQLALFFTQTHSSDKGFRINFICLMQNSHHTQQPAELRWKRLFKVKPTGKRTRDVLESPLNLPLESDLLVCLLIGFCRGLIERPFSDPPLVVRTTPRFE